MSYLHFVTHRPCAARQILVGLFLALALLPGGEILPGGVLHAQERWTSSGPAGHSPIGVMGDHTHSAGEWMFSYMFARTAASGLRDGRNRVGVDEAWARFPMVPLDMTMDMHMGHVMFAPSDRVTLMAMFMWMDHSMNTRMANSLMPGHGGMDGHMNDQGGMNGADMGHGPFHTMAHTTSGMADTEVSALVKVVDSQRRRVHLNLGVGLPTGSITDEDPRMVGGPHARLGYPMQLGSGSFEARPGVTALLQTDRFSWGAQGMGVIRVNENSEGYRRGNEARLTGWSHLRGSRWVSPGLRLEAHRWGDVSGIDPRLDPAISPEFDPGLQGGIRVNGYLAMNFQIPTGPLAGHRVALEWGGPLLESLNGPQISRDHLLNVGWEYSF